MSEGSTDLLSRVAGAAHRQGYVGEVWGTLKGHALFRGLASYALNKSAAVQLVYAQDS